MLIGSYGSGRSQALTSLLAQNIRDEKPFVYVNGHGDVGWFGQMYSIAQSYKRTDDLFCLNFLTTGEGNSHTFDPINPLIGDEESFVALFGTRFGAVLHQLCLCEKEAGDLVDTARLKSFLKLEHLECLVDYSRYAPTKESLRAYLDSLQAISQGSSEVMQINADYCASHNVSPRALQHLMNLQKVSLFIEMLDTLPIFSTTPVVDFAKVFKGNKFVVVMLPALEKDPDSLGFLTKLMTCILSQITLDFPKRSAYPAVVFDGGLDAQTIRESVLEQFKGSNTIFAYSDGRYENSTDYKTFASITQMSKAFICMRIESGFPEVIWKSARSNDVPFNAINIRDLQKLRPGHCLGWGEIGAIRKETMVKRAGANEFVFRRIDVPQAQNIKLSEKGIDA